LAFFEQLKSGGMAGLWKRRLFVDAYEQAKKDGTWNIVHDRTIPNEKYRENETLLRKSKKALENFMKMPKSTKQQFVGLYFEAKKEETRIRKLAKLIDLLEQNKKPM